MAEESWTTGHFDATLLSGDLYVGHIPADVLCQCTHALIKLLVLDAEEADAAYYGSNCTNLTPPASLGTPSSHELEFHQGFGQVDESEFGMGASGVNIMLVQDVDGVTVVVNERYYRHMKLCGVVEHMRWSPVLWRALQINLGPAGGDECSEIIGYLSTVLSEKDVSILNFSTFASDLILVQDFDTLKAKNVLTEYGEQGVQGLKAQIRERQSPSEVSETAFFFDGEEKGSASDSPRHARVESEIDEVSSLVVCPAPLVLTTIKRVLLKQCMYSLMKQLSHHIDIHIRDRAMGGESGTGRTFVNNHASDYFWAYFSTHEEVSVLMDERDLKNFPEDSLCVCPQRWKAIRLVGKDIPFNQTGVVKRMSSPYEVGIQVLNMSTYCTNVALVDENEVNDAVKKLVTELKLGEVETK
uniref:CASTOR ACT domain-containing protein n=1 Tax=Mucochytrium quahogii TaxID=96639 RepID=A0A7S2SFK8_9STRA|mmetsp:Transcript_17118/g.27684  ORF Transcript_17118/g.27684 Transcript_17118/m.27684 type:complete len:413 (-) Transcript_17118:54-1292(-)